MKADELTLKLKQKPKDYVIKPQANELSKSAVWKSFGIVFEKRARDGSEDFDEVELKYFCACVVCHKVYAYKSEDGSQCWGTKNLSNHLKQCRGSLPQKGQFELRQCLRVKPKFSQADSDLVKAKEIEFCADGYHSFRSAEHLGFESLLQTFVDLGAKNGKFDVKDNTTARIDSTRF
jgi:hypothetical protein